MSTPPTNPMDDPACIRLAYKEGVTLPNHSELCAVLTLPLPGVMIFVHGVNSDGEWYEQTERGLCDGLNARMWRRGQDLRHTGPEAGQLSPAQYRAELTSDGFINPELNADTFVETAGTYSPVIHFRWGYKASGEELQEFGKGLYLNEQNYWGGGPFANGCTNLPDLWGQGIEEELFLFLHVQHLNPTNDRKVFSAPPRPYFVLAAYRLAKLIESIRQKQADVPITLVCHSQGNMIGICAAFLGDAMEDVSDGRRKGRCVADTYVLCNPPYSLLQTNFDENWAERNMKDKKGRRGRQTFEARVNTLASFFKIVLGQKACEQDVAWINQRMTVATHPFDAQSDRDQHGYGKTPSTHGRVTLYCNPHDQVISASTVQGIGWRGMSSIEITQARGHDNFCQRVFSQGFPVGVKGVYRYWQDQWNSKSIKKKEDFWYPKSLEIAYSMKKGLDAYPGWSVHSIVGKVLTVGAGANPIFPSKIPGAYVNALPPDAWEIPLTAPDLPEKFMPVALRFGRPTPQFDQGSDSPADHRDKLRRRGAGDPMGDPSLPAPLGDAKSEASLQYETHATMRMQAKRAGKYKSDAQVVEEDKPEAASEDYKKWRSKEVKTMLTENIDSHATDHSTIMTNGMHAEKALAYDVALGVCDIREEDWRTFRLAADWRFAGANSNP